VSQGNQRLALVDPPSSCNSTIASAAASRPARGSPRRSIDGSPVYNYKCKATGSHIEQLTLEPRVVSAISGAGVKPGQIVKLTPTAAPATATCPRSSSK